MAKRHTKQFVEDMLKLYKTKPNATLDQARNRAARLGYDNFSQAAHDRYRNMAAGKRQRGKARKAPAGKQEVPAQVIMDLRTRKVFTDWAEGEPGMEVAIFSRESMGPIKLAYPKAKKRSRGRK
jgi:hypothetical protein